MKKKEKLNNYKKKNLNIVHIVPNPDGGGAEFLVRQLSNSLYKDGYNIHVLYFNNPSKVKLKKFEHCLNLKNKNDLRAIWRIRKFILNLNKLNKTIIHAHLTWPLYFTPFATFGIDTTNFYTEHNTHNRRRNFFFLKPIEKYIYSKYFKIICISKGTKKKLIKWIDNISQKKKYIVVPNGARMFELAHRKKIDPKKIKLISIGSLSKQKGFDIAIKSVSIIKNRVEKYTIIGDGEEKQKLKYLVKKLGLDKKIFLVGYQKNLRSHLHNSDLGLLPSRWEGFGLVSIEMLSTGMPLVCSNVTGLNEVVNKCEAVQMVKSENPKSMARGILKIADKLNNKSYFISSKAKRHSEKYKLELFFDRYKSLYKYINFK